MNNINQIEQHDDITSSDGISDRGRRSAIAKAFKLTGRLALSMVPVAFSGLLNKTYSQATPPDNTGERINHLLLIEYLLTEFFETATAKGLPLLQTASHLNTFQTIAKHDRQHIDIIRNRLIPFKTQAIPKPVFDFTGGSGSNEGPFKEVFSNHSVLGAVARSLKDLSVRSYIAQGDRFYIGGVNVHPVEARHSAQLRSLPFFDGLGVEEPWITRNQTTAPFDELRQIYFGEENTIQDSIQIVNINGKAITIDHASEAFDEPITMEVGRRILQQFIASS